MRRRSRTRRMLKWVGTGLSILTVAVAIVSSGRQLMWFGSNFIVGFQQARFEVFRHSPRHSRSAVISPHFSTQTLVPPGSHWLWRFEVRSFRPYGWIVDVPLWAPFMVLVAATGMLWYFDRRRFPPDHCQYCGYDLTGNVSGRCPECGTVVNRGGEKT